MEELDKVCGRDALVRWNGRWLEAWDEFRVDIDELIEGPERAEALDAVGIGS